MFGLFNKNGKEPVSKIVKMGKHPSYNFNLLLGAKYITSVNIQINDETKIATISPIAPFNEKYWRQGYGSRLVNVAIQCAKEHGCTKIVGILDESVLNNGRERILDFCQKQNFNIIEKDNIIELEYLLS